MNIAEVHLVFVGIPLLLVAIISTLIWTGKNRKGPHPQTYKMSDSWTHPPILWASEEPVDHSQGAGHDGHGAHPVTVGGGASGKW